MRASLWSVLVLVGCTSSAVVDRVDVGAEGDAQIIDVPVADAGRDARIDAAGDDGGDMLADASSDSPLPPVDGLRNGVLDPQNVYLAGTLSEGSCGRDALADYENPNVAVVGFDCHFDSRTAIISAAGTLTYINTFEDRLREFTCDDCPGWTPSDPYPTNFQDNDIILPTPLCDDGDLGAFALSPDGSRMHRCRRAGSWYDESGAQLLEANTTVLTYGWSGIVLTDDAVIDTQTGVSTPLTGLPADCETLTTRSGPDTGFRVAAQCEETTELWFVDHSGNAERVGVYPPPPPSYPPHTRAARLAGDGTLVQEARGPETFEATIIERTIEGRSELMYTEASSPAVKMHISYLVTGP